MIINNGYAEWCYCRAIKNKDKRQYAFAYLAWKCGQTDRQPEPPANLSLMGAQAVRMNLEHVRPFELPAKAGERGKQ